MKNHNNKKIHKDFSKKFIRIFPKIHKDFSKKTLGFFKKVQVIFLKKQIKKHNKEKTG